MSGPLYSPLHIPGRLSFLELSHWAPLSSGSSWFLPMGGTNRRSQEGRREIGVFISRVPRCWAADWLWLPVLLKVTVPARLFCTTTVAVMSGNLVSLSSFRPWCVSGTPPLIALSCFTIAGWLPLNPLQTCKQCLYLNPPLYTDGVFNSRPTLMQNP